MNPTIRIVNISATFSLSIPLNLGLLSKNLPDAKYRPYHFNGLVYKIKTPKCTAIIFSTGRVTICGLNQEHLVSEMAQLISDRINHFNLDTKPSSICIQNVVGAVDLGYELDLRSMFEASRIENSFEPELFPGLVYHERNSSRSMLCFRSGKLILTGCNSIPKVKEFFDNIHWLFENSKKMNVIKEEQLRITDIK